MKEKSKNLDTLMDFADYCYRHKQQRFWQALRNWSGYSCIMGKYGEGITEDTFYIDKVVADGSKGMQRGV